MIQWLSEYRSSVQWGLILITTKILRTLHAHLQEDKGKWMVQSGLFFIFILHTWSTHFKAVTESRLEVRRAVLLLTLCSNFGFWLYCLVGKGFFFLCVCKVCLLLIRTKLFCLKFFKGKSCLFLVKSID